MSPKSLPDSPGWWLREGVERPVEVEESGGGFVYLTSTGFKYACCRGRWLKVELPTFPPPEKAPYRLCWATYDGNRLLCVYDHCTGELKFRTPGFSGNWVRSDAVTDVVWITPEYLDELPSK
jgi:hypothetical protein